MRDSIGVDWMHPNELANALFAEEFAKFLSAAQTSRAQP